MKVCIIGAGATGLTAAFKLAGKGFEVTVFEKEDYAGGLAGTLPVGSTRLERFYHHIFTNDTIITGLLEELGLGGSLKWAAPSNAIYSGGKLRPFTSPMDLLRFNEISFLSRIRTGLLVLKARSVKNWMDFEKMSARDWLVKNAGKDSYEKLWSPLLQSKFGCDAGAVSAVWIWNKFKLRGSSRGKNISSEMLGYVTGSFDILYDELQKKIRAAGGKIHFNEEIRKIRLIENLDNPDSLNNHDSIDSNGNPGTSNNLAGKPGRIGSSSKSDSGIPSIEVTTSKRTEAFDIVLSTTSPAALTKLVGDFSADYVEKLDSIKYKANVCILLELSRKLSQYYWITVAEKDSPFVIVAEHTNLFPDEKYGSNIVYLSRYTDEKDELYSLSDEALLNVFTGALAKMFPDWDRSRIKSATVSRARYAQPVVKLGYSEIIPQFESPLKNLYLASMAQIYPEDRGQNYAIRAGMEVADLIAENSIKRCKKG